MLTADEAVAAADVRDAHMELTLPGKLGFGGRYDFGALALASDIELGFNSQNESSVISGTRTDGVLGDDGEAKVEEVDNVFRWQDSITARLGAEYVLVDRYALRAGYVFDGKVANAAYPSAFGTPPAASHSVTLGIGYLGDDFQLNLALARRSVSTSVAPDDIGDDPPCATCAPPGDDFSLELYGLYVDYSIDFGDPP
jgi:long-subunit fatty acid transport protein